MPEHEMNAENQSREPDAAECLIEFVAMAWEIAAPGLRVKQLCRGDHRIRLIEFSENFVEVDWCLSGHVGYVVEGTLEIDYSGRVVRYRAGDGLCIPSGELTKHKANVPCGKAILFVVEQTDTQLLPVK